MAWYKSPISIFGKNSNGNDAWFSDGELNFSCLALDYHIEQERGDQVALICDSPVTNSTASYIYSELRDEVATFAGVLDWLGVSKGDRVIIYAYDSAGSHCYSRVRTHGCY